MSFRRKGQGTPAPEDGTRMKEGLGPGTSDLVRKTKGDTTLNSLRTSLPVYSGFVEGVDTSALQNGNH